MTPTVFDVSPRLFHNLTRGQPVFYVEIWADVHVRRMYAYFTPKHAKTFTLDQKFLSGEWQEGCTDKRECDYFHRSILGTTW